MPDRAAASHDALRRSLASRLGSLGTPLELIASDLVGEEDDGIDWVAAAPDGTAWVILIEADEAGPALLARGLVQRAWVAARIADWCQLAPSLSLRAEIRPRLLLIARAFGRPLRIAAREAGGGSIRLARWTGDEADPQLELLDAPPRARLDAPASPPPPRALASVFRTGLTDADLAG